ncbi:MAG: hypothetical protein HY040_12410 [Planctomycetes bacterium]|nr:hypothetical protein [Planctomycetota bacterium]
MAAPSDSKLPEWIVKRDGRRVPFEPDRISQSLFAAAESLGRPDAFLARELADGVLHFLAQEAEAGAEAPTTGQVAELIVKVVRELGQPELARAFQEHAQKNYDTDAAAVRRIDPAEVTFRFSTRSAPEQVTNECLAKFSLHAVFSRDLRSALEEGYLTVSGLTDPDALASVVLEGVPAAWGDWIQTLRQSPARTVIVDSPELLWKDRTPLELTQKLADLATLAESLRRTITLNLNCAEPPGWARAHVHGPLFTTEPTPQTVDADDPAERVLAAVNRIVTVDHPLHVEWHLSEAAFAHANRGRLEHLLRLGIEKPWLRFVLDRPKQEIVLGAGLDRRHSGVFVEVGLSLPRLLDLTEGRLEPFLEKLPSLARMGARAAAQKHNYLRRRSEADKRLARAFLLDRARGLVSPIGLDAVVNRLLGRGMAQSRLSLDLGRKIVGLLWQTLEAEGRNANLDVVFSVFPEEGSEESESADRRVEPNQFKAQMQACAALLGEACAGTASILLRGTESPLEIAEALLSSWEKGFVVQRVRLL